jgi:mannose-6-phosphate isomerase-like protein (cupin superfamily)
VPIYFFDILDGAGWDPIKFDPADVNNYWSAKGKRLPLTAAPVDFTATLDGAVWASTKVELPFGWRGRRLRPNFSMPKRHHNLRQLMIVLGGELQVEYGEKGAEAEKIGPNEFWVAEAETPYTMTSGPDGAIYLECWDGPVSTSETFWHDDSNWVRR